MKKTQKKKLNKLLTRWGLRQTEREVVKIKEVLKEVVPTEKLMNIFNTLDSILELVKTSASLTEKQLKDVDKEIASLVKQVSEIKPADTTDLEERFNKIVGTLRTDLFDRVSHGGGSKPLKISVDGAVMSKKYADVNLKSGTNITLSPADNNTSKQVDITVSGGGVTSVASADSSITVTNPTTTVDLAVVKAPKLSTARNIAGVPFDGTADIALAAANLSNGTVGSGAVVLASGATITTPVITQIVPGANFTLKQNSVNALTSEESGAIVNTLYLKTGFVGLGGATSPATTLHLAKGFIRIEDSSTTGFDIKNTNATFRNALSVGTAGNPNFLSNWDLSTNAQDDATKPSWGINLSTSGDATSIQRAAAGGSLTTLVSVNSSGAIKERSRTTAIGEWITPAFNAGDYTANGGTWTVGSGDVERMSYTLVGKTMTLNWNLTTTTIAGATAQLRIAIPGGFTAASGVQFGFNLYDNATGIFEIGFVQALSSGTFVTLFRPTLATFTNGTDNQLVRGFITFEVA